MSAPAVASIRSAIGSLVAPGFCRSLGDLKAVRNVTAGDDGGLSVTVELPIVGYSREAELRQQIEAEVRTAGAVAADVTVVGSVSGLHAGGKVGLKVANVLAVGSGKGGVGKSTVATGLALGLKNRGARVGLMDADVYGPSVPHLLGVHGPPGMREVKDADGQVLQRMIPLDGGGLPVMSMGFLVEREQAVVWRGPMLHKALQQFMQQTEWGELDYLVIDLPPGTGDVSLTLSQLVGLSGAVVVCTPQQVALLDAVKAVSMYNQVKIPVLGVVENMTGELFGRGGAKAEAEKLGVGFLGEVPAIAALRESADAGKMHECVEPGHPAAAALDAVAETVAIRCAEEVVKAGPAPSLQIL
ncbi:MAG: Mrp/NBP35 family ATP-binding protein [Planctomycetota bacterium]